MVFSLTHSQDRFKDRVQELAKDPGNIVFASLSEDLRQARKLYQALEICLRGTSRNPKYPGGWFTLGNIYLDLEQADQSLKAFQKAVQLDSDHWGAQEKLADLHIHSKNWLEARYHLQILLRLSPTHTRVRQLLAHAESRCREAEVAQKNQRVAASILSNDSFHKIKFRLNLVRQIKKLFLNRSST
jgi:tetratricopeptide (TPR) repeat protein